MVQIQPVSSQFSSDFRLLQGKSEGWLKRFRASAMDIFEEVGLPTARKGNEKWKYTNVAPVARLNFELARNDGSVSLSEIKSSAPWCDSWINIVFVNGIFIDEFSDRGIEGISISNIAENSNLKEPRDQLTKKIGAITDIYDEGFAALNTSFLSDGIVISVESGVESDTPINIIFFNSGVPNQVAHPRVLISASQNSSVSIIENYVGGGADPTLTNSVCKILVGVGATVTHYRLLDESEDSYDVGYGRVRVSEGARFESRSFFKGANIGRYDLNVLIDGDGGSCNLQGLYFTSGSQHMDNFINIDHAKPNGVSNLFYKGILDGRSRAVFGGTVLVRREAQKTDSIQSDKNLILSPHAEIDSKPALFIYADDVKCAHGATAGNIDEDTVFYMRSRGVDLETASRLLIYGFAGEIIETVEIETLREYLQNIFLSSLPSYKFEF